MSKSVILRRLGLCHTTNIYLPLSLSPLLVAVSILLRGLGLLQQHAFLRNDGCTVTLRPFSPQVIALAICYARRELLRVKGALVQGARAVVHVLSAGCVVRCRPRAN